MNRVPPPTYYFSFIILGLALDRAYPLYLNFGVLGTWLGLFILLSSFILVGLVLREFKQAGTSFKDDSQVNVLMTTGPFAFSRNPMYISITLLQLGIGIFLGYVWVLIGLLPALHLTTRFAIIPEESLLTEKFGEAYIDYCSKVRRWL